MTLITILALAIASPAFAAKSTGLAVGGRTLAGPGATSLAVGTSATVFSNGDRDACVTVANVGKSAVELSAIGATTSAIDIAAGGTGALCKLALDQVDLTCIGTTSCSAQWRVDDN